MFIAMMGADGLTEATRVAILSANYIAARLSPYFPILYKGQRPRRARMHPRRPRLETSANIEVEDIAKRLMDYGFHAPTMSWPVPGTLMIEPTESESKVELDRFCDAMIAIHGELCAIERGELSPTDNPLKFAPHTATAVTSDSWKHPYSRELAAYRAMAERA
jgi:glycine dehydrogenase